MFSFKHISSFLDKTLCRNNNMFQQYVQTWAITIFHYARKNSKGYAHILLWQIVRSIIDQYGNNFYILNIWNSNMISICKWDWVPTTVLIITTSLCRTNERETTSSRELISDERLLSCFACLERNYPKMRVYSYRNRSISKHNRWQLMANL